MRTIGENPAQDVKVNQYKLDEENAISGELRNTWGERHAEVLATVDALEAKFDLTKAQKVLFYSNNPLEGIKPTGDNVKAMVEVDPEVQEAQDALLRARGKKYVLDSFMKDLDHRKSGVDNLVQLYTRRYYDTKQTNGDCVSDAINDGLNRIS
jgi:hypothetical protein